MFKNEIITKTTEKVDPSWLVVLSLPNRPPLTYIPIDKTIRFLNENFGDEWHICVEKELWSTIGINNIPFVTITVALMIRDTIRHGVGSDRYKGKTENMDFQIDPDKMIKTAYANAVKKATNMFGFGLELWDEKNTSDYQPPTSTPKYNNQPQNNDKDQLPETLKQPNILSEKGRSMVENFITTTGLSKEDIKEFMLLYEPNSDGSPATMLKDGYEKEEENLNKFFDFVRSKIQKT